MNEDGFSKNIMSAIAFEMSLIERKDYSASETRQKRTLHSKDTERTVSNIFTKQQEVSFGLQDAVLVLRSKRQI